MTTKIVILIVIVSSLWIRHEQSVLLPDQHLTGLQRVSGTQAAPAPVAVAVTARAPQPVAVIAPAFPCTARAARATLTTYFNAKDQAVREDLEITVEGTASTFTLNTSSSAIDGKVSGGRVLVSLEAGEVAPFSVSFPNCSPVRLEPLRSSGRI